MYSIFNILICFWCRGCRWRCCLLLWTWSPLRAWCPPWPGLSPSPPRPWHRYHCCPPWPGLSPTPPSLYFFLLLYLPTLLQVLDNSGLLLLQNGKLTLNVDSLLLSWFPTWLQWLDQLISHVAAATGSADFPRGCSDWVSWWCLVKDFRQEMEHKSRLCLV